MARVFNGFAVLEDNPELNRRFSDVNTKDLLIKMSSSNIKQRYFHVANLEFHRCQQIIYTPCFSTYLQLFPRKINSYNECPYASALEMSHSCQFLGSCDILNWEKIITATK